MFVVQFFILTSFIFNRLQTKQFCKSENQLDENFDNIDFNLITDNQWKIHSYSQLKAPNINQNFFPPHGSININIQFDKLAKHNIERGIIINRSFNLKFYCTDEKMIAETNISSIRVPFSTSNPSQFMVTYLNEGCQTYMVFTRSKVALQMDIDNELLLIFTCYDVAKEGSLLVLRKTEMYWSQFNNRSIKEFALNMSSNFFHNNDIVNVNFENGCMDIEQCNRGKLFSQTESSDETNISSDFNARRLLYIGSGIGLICICIIIKVIMNHSIMDKIMNILSPNASNKVYPILN